MNIDVILLLYIHFSPLSNSIHFSLKGRDSPIKILINELSEIFDSNWALKPQRKRELRFIRNIQSKFKP